MSKLATGVARLISAGAWFFAVTSVLTVAGIFVVHAVSDGAESRIWGIDGRDGRAGFDAFGLTYRGVSGQWIAGLEVVLVTVCLVMSTGGGRTPGLSRLGHGGLVLWNGLWLVNSIWYTVLDTHAVTVAVTLGVAVCLACTLMRAVSSVSD